MTRLAIYLGLACLLAGAIAWVAVGWAAGWWKRIFGNDQWYAGRGYSG